VNKPPLTIVRRRDGTLANQFPELAYAAPFAGRMMLQIQSWLWLRIDAKQADWSSSSELIAYAC